MARRRRRLVSPGVHYFVGGTRRSMALALPRLRQADFGEIQRGGVSPGWPISYEELAPYYDRAERLFWVHGEAEPTDRSTRSGPFPFPPMPPDPYMRNWRRIRTQVASGAAAGGSRLPPRRTMHPLRNVRRIPVPGAGEKGTPTSVRCDRRSPHPTWRSGPMRSCRGCD